jgi:hypothetical protein
VRFIRNTIDANPKMIGNESSDIVGGEDICDSHGLFSRCHVTDGHDKPPNSLILGMGPSNPPRNVTLPKKLECVAIAPQLLAARASCQRRLRAMSTLSASQSAPLSHKLCV